ncbi:hypothetical protein K8M07_12110 [Schnuerera sp. xch1]|uniref:hypothetical protein n=1 Tax=Schnuerera sp. xch1 TaxID=2874283 RepID=UPI001CC092BD|nr:hypothetical protein [Schnuerera sp. xch1]MBZ2175983.1 hypothetical protein [Schnuerera sp. xch1]
MNLFLIHCIILLNESTEEEQLNILETSIQDAGQVIVDIYSRFIFEKELFERRKEHSLSVNELKQMMISFVLSAKTILWM